MCACVCGGVRSGVRPPLCPARGRCPSGRQRRPRRTLHAGGGGWRLWAEWTLGPQWTKTPSGLSLCPGRGLCESLQTGVLSGRAGPGHTLACGAEGRGLSPVQCDLAQGSCWCVLGSGEEVPGTRVAGNQPACESKPWALLICSFPQAGGVWGGGGRARDSKGAGQWGGGAGVRVRPGLPLMPMRSELASASRKSSALELRLGRGPVGVP